MITQQKLFKFVKTVFFCAYKRQWKKKKNTRQLAFTKPGVIWQNNSKYIEFSTTQVFITSKKTCKHIQ